MAITTKFLANAVGTYYATLSPQSGASAGKTWNGASYESWTDGNVANYGVLLTRQGTGLEYLLTLPPAADQFNEHDAKIYLRAGSNPNPLAAGDVQSGTGSMGGPMQSGVLPSVVSGSAGALPTTGTGSNQISLTNGEVDLGKVLGVTASADGNGYLNVNAADINGNSAQTDLAGCLVVTSNIALLNGVVGTGSTSTTLVRSAFEGNIDDFHKGLLLHIISGNFVGQARRITGYVSATKTFSVDRPWIGTGGPASGDYYVVHSDVGPALDASLRMDLVNSPNSTAIAAIQSGLATSAAQTSILNAVNAITTNTARSAPRVPTWFVRPASGTAVFRSYLYLYNLQGVLEDADTQTVTVHASTSTGSHDLDGNLSSTTMTHQSTGVYYVDYTCHSTDATGEVFIDFSWTVNAAAMKDAGATVVEDADTISTINAIKLQTDKIGQNSGDSANTVAMQGNAATLLGRIPGVIQPQTGDSYSLLSSLFAGITSLASWICAGFRKDAPDPVALAEINAARNSISGTYSSQTDSLQGASDGVAGKLTVLPVSSSVSSGDVTRRDVVVAQYTDFGPLTFCLRDQRGNPINVSGHAISFVVADTNGVHLWQIDSCPVGGTDNNIVTVDAGDTNTQISGQFNYGLRDRTTNHLLAYGDLTIFPVPKAE